MFDDPLSLTALDQVVDGEQRFRTVGAALPGVVLVAHTLRDISEGEELVRDHLGSLRNIARKEDL